jgi:phage terminase Nu1 subunit (DNA packaging protein)
MEEHADENIPVLAEEKLRLLRAQADTAELRLKKEQGTLCDVEEIQSKVAICFCQFREIMGRTISKTDANLIMRQFQDAHTPLEIAKYRVTKIEG